MLLRLLVALSLSLPLILSSSAWSAEIYTFGKRSNGTRYVKSVERSQKKESEQPAASTSNAASGKIPPPVPPGRSTAQPLGNMPPPPVDPRKLDILDRPI